MAKTLTDLIGENYLDNYSQKTEVGKSFVAMHRDNKVIDKQGEKGSTDAQRKSAKGRAPYKIAPQTGFPAETQKNDYNLPTYYDDADEGNDNDVDNDHTRARQVHESEDDDEIIYVTLAEGLKK